MGMFIETNFDERALAKFLPQLKEMTTNISSLVVVWKKTDWKSVAEVEETAKKMCRLIPGHESLKENQEDFLAA